LPGFGTGGLAPEAALATLHCFCPTALAFLPGNKPTACTRRQPHLYEGMTLVQVDGGAPAARFSGSAAGAGGQRDRRMRRSGLPDFGERRAPRVDTHPPPRCMVQVACGFDCADRGRAARVATRPPRRCIGLMPIDNFGEQVTCLAMAAEVLMSGSHHLARFAGCIETASSGARQHQIWCAIDNARDGAGSR